MDILRLLGHKTILDFCLPSLRNIRVQKIDVGKSQSQKLNKSMPFEMSAFKSSDRNHRYSAEGQKLFCRTSRNSNCLTSTRWWFLQKIYNLPKRLTHFSSPCRGIMGIPTYRRTVQILLFI